MDYMDVVLDKTCAFYIDLISFAVGDSEKNVFTFKVYYYLACMQMKLLSFVDYLDFKL